MIRKVRIDDIDQILQIEQDNFDNPWNEGQFLYEIKDNPYSSIYVVEQNGEIMAFYDLWLIFDRAELANIAVKKQYQKQGFGLMMMKHLEQQAMDNGCETISLEVRVNNQQAINLYNKCGFTTINIRKDYYETKDGHVDGYLMMKGI